VIDILSNPNCKLLVWKTNDSEKEAKDQLYEQKNGASVLCLPEEKGEVGDGGCES
jgi:hypothetical protein